MNLNKITKTLQQIAPLSLAEGWDNVGLLVEPSPPHIVTRIMLTNDLTEEVMREAVERKAGLIVSYHPPIFRPLKRLVWNNPKQRIVTLAMENRVAVYSPHTSCDAVGGGVNDWLAASLGNLNFKHPVKPTDEHATHTFRITTQDGVGKQLRNCIERNYPAGSRFDEGGGASCEVKCKSGQVAKLVNLIGKCCEDAGRVRLDHDVPDALSGMGRVCLLEQNAQLDELIARVKYHIGVPHLRVAVAEGKSVESPVRTVALCAGSGASLLAGLKSDLFLTGEMSHHEVLAATAAGTSVILCEHSNTERGYLPAFGRQIAAGLGNKDVEVFVSQLDKDPLTVM